MKKFLVLLLALFIPFCAALGQKVKYKELYPLLESRQYDLAIPLLRKYILDPKGQVNANAHLQMALYLEKVSMEQDIIKNTAGVSVYSDSAVMFYQKTRNLLTEKQLKKNQDYYRSYERRDVRTGKVGIKVADIQYQLGKNIDQLDNRKAVVKQVKDHYTKGKGVYSAAQTIFEQLKKSYPTEKALYLKSDQEVLELLDSLDVLHSSALKEISDFKSLLGNVDRPGYAPGLNVIPIQDYQQDGLSGIDPELKTLEIWDYSEWTKSVKLEVLENVWPLRKELLDYDAMLNEVTAKVRTDSVPYQDEIKPYGELKTKLMAYDKDPLPLKVFEVKKAELEYLSKALAHMNYRDSADWVYRAEALKQKLSGLSALDSTVRLLSDSPWKTEWSYYENYIHSSFGELPVFEEFIHTNTTFAGDKRVSVEEEFKQIKERSKWLIDDRDSIPLFDIDDPGYAGRFMPVILEEEYTAGLYFPEPGDSAKGYFSLVNNERIPESKVFFDIPGDYFNESSVLDILSKVDIDEKGQIYHLMFYLPLAEQENYAASLCKIYTSDGLAWEKDLILDTAPAGLEISSMSGEVKIEYDLIGYSGDKELPNEIVLDKKGVLKK